MTAKRPHACWINIGTQGCAEDVTVFLCLKQALLIPVRFMVEISGKLLIIDYNF